MVLPIQCFSIVVIIFEIVFCPHALLEDRYVAPVRLVLCVPFLVSGLLRRGAALGLDNPGALRSEMRRSYIAQK